MALFSRPPPGHKSFGHTSTINARVEVRNPPSPGKVKDETPLMESVTWLLEIPNDAPKLVLVVLVLPRNTKYNVRMKLVRSFTLMIGIFLICKSLPALADGAVGRLDPAFAEKAKLTGQEKVLLIGLCDLVPNPTDQYYGKCKNEKFFKSKDKDPISCVVFGESKDCPTPFYTMGDTRYFIVKNQNGSWIELYLDFSLKRTLWVNLGTKSPKLITLTDWVTSFTGLSANGSGNQKISLYDKPNSNNTISSCNGFPPGGELGLVRSKKKQSDATGWVYAHCEEESCYSENTPRFDSDYCDNASEADVKKKLQELQKKYKACKEGWVRWLSPEGKILLYPQTGPDC
jgi:hypothetical protein